MDSEISARVLDLAAAIQQIPSPTFEESKRAGFVLSQFRAAGLEQVSIDDLGNVYGCLAGEGKSPAVILSAHLDTVFPSGTDLSLIRLPDRLCGPGIGDNALGVAGLLGIVWSLQEKQHGATADHGRLAGDLWVVATVGEEGLGNLRGMRAVVERFGADVSAYIGLEGMSLGQIYYRALGVQRYRIRVETAGGHSWVDFGQPSAINEIAALVTRLTSLRLPRRPRTTLNAGTISGGTSVNTIAARAEVELDLRSEDPATLQTLASQVERLVQAANRPGVRMEMASIGNRPVGEISIRHPLVRIAQRCLAEQGLQVHLGIGSTDTNIPLSKGIPAICVGLTQGGGAHTREEYILTEPLQRGLPAIANLVERVCNAAG